MTRMLLWGTKCTVRAPSLGYKAFVSHFAADVFGREACPDLIPSAVAKARMPRGSTSTCEASFLNVFHSL